MAVVRQKEINSKMYTNSKYPLLFYDPWCRKVTFSVTSCFLGSNEIIEYASYRNSIIYRLAYFWIMRILWNKGGGAYGCRLALITQMLKISEKETSKLFNVCGTKRIILEESNLPKLFRRKEKQALRSSCELLRTKDSKDSKRNKQESSGTFRDLQGPLGTFRGSL